jgi:hypothetical protein
MGLWTLVGVWGGAAALRLAYILAHRDPDSLWYDFERRGQKFQLARLLDYATFGVFLLCAAWALWKHDARDSGWLGTFFVAWLGWSLLERFPVHRFPRMNRPGLFERAKMNLVANLIMAVLSAAVATGLVAAYFWWRGEEAALTPPPNPIH